MTVYIRNPFNRSGVATNSGDHNYIQSSYTPVTNYTDQDNEVTYLYSADSQRQPQGSGAFISPYLIVTAQHVVQDGGTWEIDYGPNTNGQFSNTTTSSTTSKGKSVGSISTSSMIGTITASTPYSGVINGLEAVGKGGNSKLNSYLKSAVIEGFPGSATNDVNDGSNLQILFSDSDGTQPITTTTLYKETVNAAPSATGAWNDSQATLAAGNSGGPLFVTDGSGKTFLVGGLNTANATGKNAAQSAAAGASLGAGGYLFTHSQVQSLTQAAKAADPNGGKSGWWLTEPENSFYASDTDNEILATDDRSDTIVIGQAATDVVGSIGNDTIIGNGQIGSDIRYASINVDDDTTKGVIAEISSVNLSVDMGASGHGDMSAVISDTSGGTSNQTISGISQVTLSTGDDVVNVSSQPVVVADSGSGIPETALSSQSPVIIDGGDGKNTFNVDYINSLSGDLLLEGGAGDDTFNLTDADGAYETIIWGGGGSNTFNINTSGNAEADLLTVNVDGLTSDNFKQLDTAAFDSYLDQTYGVDPHRIVVLNAGNTDALRVNGVTITDPSSFIATEVDTSFLGSQYFSDGNTDAHSLSQGPGTTIEGYTGTDTGFVPDQWNDTTSVNYTYGMTDGTSVFSAGASWEDLYGTWHLHIGTPSDVNVWTYYNNYDDMVQSTAQNLDPNLDVDPADHTKSVATAGTKPFYDSQGQQIGYDYNTGSEQNPVQVSQFLNTSKGVNIENLTQGAFGLNMTADQTLPWFTTNHSSYNVGSWSSYEVDFHQPNDADGGPNSVNGYAPDFAQSTLVSSDSQTIDFDQTVQNYFDYGSQIAATDITSMIKDRTVFVSSNPDAVIQA